MDRNYHTLIENAKAGDKKALEDLVKAIQDLIYNLSLKMLLFPDDAKDASQEILIRIITNLASFQYKSQFETWVYRVASNYLLTYSGKRAKRFAMPFEAYAELIDNGQSEQVRFTQNSGELAMLEEEVKVSCTQGLLLCLNQEDRLVYILSEILEFNSKEGSAIMDISAVSFRKKLSRSRLKVRNFLNQKCGLANPDNPCRCKRKIDFLIEEKIIDPLQLRFGNLAQRSIDLVKKLGTLERSIAIYRSTPEYVSPESILKEISSVLIYKNGNEKN